MAWYRTGTVAVTNGSKTVTGTGTAWVNNVQPGDAFIGPDGAYNEIDVVGGNTSLTLVDDYAGTTASGAAYKIIPTQGRVRDMAAAVLQLINDYSAVESAFTIDGGNVRIGRLSAISGAGEKLSLEANSTGFSMFAQQLNVAGYGLGIKAKENLYLYADSGANVGSLSNDGTKLNVVATNALNISVNGADRVAVDESGNVGIGTASPTPFGAGYGVLSINGLTAGVLDLMSAGSSALRVFCAPTEARLQCVLNAPMKFYTDNTLRGQFKAAGQFNLEPLASDPAGGAGDLYFNGITGKFRGHTGSGWEDLH